MLKRCFRSAIGFMLAVSFAGIALADDVTFVRIGTSSVGGGFYQIGNTIAQLGNRQVKDMNFTAVTGGSAKNCFNLAKEDIELGIVQSATLQDAWKGEGPFDGKPLKDLRFVTAIYPMPFHILVNRKAAIEKIGDFKGKRVDLGPIGGGIEVNAQRIFDIYGLTMEDVNIQRFGRSEVSEALKTGRSEAHIWATSIPNAMVTDMVNSDKVGLIGLENDKIKKIVDVYPAFSASFIPGGVYAGFDQDIPTVAAVGVLVTHKDMSDEVIYKITKMLYENVDFLKKRLNYFKYFSLDHALDGKCLDIHPGAKKFYQEQGLF